MLANPRGKDIISTDEKEVNKVKLNSVVFHQRYNTY